MYTPNPIFKTDKRRRERRYGPSKEGLWRQSNKKKEKAPKSEYGALMMAWATSLSVANFVLE